MSTFTTCARIVMRKSSQSPPIKWTIQMFFLIYTHSPVCISESNNRLNKLSLIAWKDPTLKREWLTGCPRPHLMTPGKEKFQIHSSRLMFIARGDILQKSESDPKPLTITLIN